MFASVLRHLQARYGDQVIALKVPPADGKERDDDGEDGRLSIAGVEVAVQTVVLCPDPAFYQRVARGGAAVDASTAQAAARLHQQVEIKRAHYPNPMEKILAIDLSHFGVLAMPAVIAEDRRTFPDAGTVFGSVLLVGPLENLMAPLGSSRW